MSDSPSLSDVVAGAMTVESVEQALDMVRPALQGDGGDVQVVDVKDGTVTVRLVGSCHGCPSSTATLKMGLENFLREQFPEMKELVSA